MNLSDFIDSFQGMARERIHSRITTIVLAVTCLLLVFALINKSPVVVLVPPELSQESEIANNNASAEVKKAWGLMVANLVGNVTPGNVNFAERSLKGLLAPHLYHELLESLQQQASTIKEGQITLTFVPTDVTFQASKNKVFVAGDMTKKGPFSEPVTEKKTYEFEIVVRNYRPYVAFWEVYSGGPRIDHSQLKEPREPVQMSMKEIK
jgi:conjugal transfer pilus assembly protein TraE